MGANKAGKSSLIEALRLVLGGRRRYVAHRADFHRLNAADEMRIELRLREPLFGWFRVASIAVAAQVVFWVLELVVRSDTTGKIMSVRRGAP